MPPNNQYKVNMLATLGRNLPLDILVGYFYFVSPAIANIIMLIDTIMAFEEI